MKTKTALLDELSFTFSEPVLPLFDRAPQKQCLTGQLSLISVIIFSIGDHSKLRRFGEGRRWRNLRGRARCVICVLIKLLGLGLFAVSEEAIEDEHVRATYT